MQVAEVMSRHLRTIEPKSTLMEAARKMSKYNIGGLIVTSAFEIKGIITERDIMEAFASGKKSSTPVSAVMTKRVYTIDHNATLEEAAKVMLKHHIKRLPVVKKGRCIGIITATDLISYEEKLIDKISLLFLLPRKKVEAV